MTRIFLYSLFLVGWWGITDVSGLQCYDCGSQGAEMSTVNPCFSVSDDDLKSCDDGYCRRYDNKGVIVLSCADECIEREDQNTEITCCRTDGCNSADIMNAKSPLIFICLVFFISCFNRII